MIEYDSTECFGVAIVFRCAGSVIPRNVPQAMASTVICLLVVLFAGDSDTLSYKPYGERVMGVVLGILLVFRSAFALRRFWEARSYLAKCTSMLADLGRDSRSFSTKDVNVPTEAALEFQAKMARLLRLLLCVMFQNLTGATRISDWKAHEYLEEHEVFQLRHDARTRPYLVMSWIIESFVDLHLAGMLAVPPPALNNAMRECSDALLFYNQAQKIADTQFPFPMIQMSKILMAFFLIVTPIVLALNPGSIPEKLILSFIVVLAFASVDAIAIELSDPFGDDDNDLPLHDIMEEHNKFLSIVLPRQAKGMNVTKSVHVDADEVAKQQNPDVVQTMDTMWLKQNKAQISEMLRMCHEQELQHRRIRTSLESQLDDIGYSHLQAPGAQPPQNGSASAGSLQM